MPGSSMRPGSHDLGTTSGPPHVGPGRNSAVIERMQAAVRMENPPRQFLKRWPQRVGEAS